MMPGSPSTEEPPEPQAQRSEVSLATITLRQIRVSRADVQDKPSSTDANPMNRLVPYLDLYGRLSDDELARLAGVPADVAANLRRQVVQVDRALARFTDLLPRLSDAELVRLTGATPKTIRFWRLCQPRYPSSGNEAQGWSVAQAADALGRVQSSAELPRRSGSTASGTGSWHAAMSEEPPIDSGAPLEPQATRLPVRHPSGETASVAGYRMPIAEREAGSSAQRLPVAEREAGSSAQRLPTADRDSPSSAYRMPTADRDAGRRPVEPSSSGTSSTRVPMASVDLSRPRTGRTEEVPAAQGAVPPLPSLRSQSQSQPPVAQKQQAVAQQMKFSGAPFPGHELDGDGTVPEEEDDDGIFIGLELPDPRTLSSAGRRE